MKRIALALALVSVGSAPLISASATAAPRVLHAQAQYGGGISNTLPLIRLTFSAPVLAQALPPLHVSPALLTTWQQVSATQVQAMPLRTPVAGGGYRVDVPTALRCAAACTVLTTSPYVTPLEVSMQWQEQLLAALNYLPVRFIATATSADPVAQVAGYFSWRFPHLPASLQAQWSPGQPSVILQGALMHFQSVHNLPVSGTLDNATWHALVHDVTSKSRNPSAYNYVDVTETQPETTTLYVNGVATFHTLANTGIAQAPTSLGTYPVYLRYTSQTMQGTNPDGSHYYDTGIPWVSYFHGGDALHGFLRPSYGFPQSLGCVEMPFDAAKVIWPFTPIGTLVTVRP